MNSKGIASSNGINGLVAQPNCLETFKILEFNFQQQYKNLYVLCNPSQNFDTADIQEIFLTS